MKWPTLTRCQKYRKNQKSIVERTIPTEQSEARFPPGPTRPCMTRNNLSLQLQAPENFWRRVCYMWPHLLWTDKAVRSDSLDIDRSVWKRRWRFTRRSESITTEHHRLIERYRHICGKDSGGCNCERKVHRGKILNLLGRGLWLGEIPPEELST